MLPLLKHLADDQALRLMEAVEALYKQFDLTPEECSQQLPSQRQGIYIWGFWSKTPNRLTVAE